MFTQRRTRGGLLVAAALALLQGCTDSGPMETRAAPDAAQASVELVARGVSVALAKPELRARLLAGFRDSPFQQNRIQLTQYLAGEDGAALARAAAEGAGVSEERFAAVLASLPPLSIYVPRIIDRVNWNGHDRLVVAPSLEDAEKFASASSRTGFAPDGKAVRYDPRTMQDFVVLLIRPAGREFGANPEQRRKFAPKRAGSTITTATGPAHVVSSDCGMYARECESTGSGGGGTTATGILMPSNVTSSACRNAPTDDADADGYSDACEYQLAYSFRPHLVMDTEDDAPGREPYWSVRGAGRDSVQVAYLLSYYFDPGEPVSGWWDHNGDSEFIILTLRNVTGTSRWVVMHAVLSAHWGTDSDATYDGGYGSLQFPFTPQGRPRVWVAENKHANYATQSSCEWGGYGADECDSPDGGNALEVLAHRNIGNYTSVRGQKVIDCVQSVAGDSYRTATECFFTTALSGDYFAGWVTSPYREGSHAPHYRHVLATWWFMPKPGGSTIGEPTCGMYAKTC
jgi:hypothetical protein